MHRSLDIFRSLTEEDMKVSHYFVYFMITEQKYQEMTKITPKNKNHFLLTVTAKMTGNSIMKKKIINI